MPARSVPHRNDLERSTKAVNSVTLGEDYLNAVVEVANSPRAFREAAIDGPGYFSRRGVVLPANASLGTTVKETGGVHQICVTVSIPPFFQTTYCYTWDDGEDEEEEDTVA